MYSPVITAASATQRTVTGAEKLCSIGAVPAVSVADGFPVGNSDTTTIITMSVTQSRKDSNMKWGQCREK